jgi:hypothetical protein
MSRSGWIVLSIALLFVAYCVGHTAIGYHLNPLNWNMPSIEFGEEEGADCPEHGENEVCIGVIVTPTPTPTQTPVPTPTATPVPRQDEAATSGTKTFPAFQLEENEVLIIGGEKATVNEEELGQQGLGALKAYDDITEYTVTVTRGAYIIVSTDDARSTFCEWYDRLIEKEVLSDDNAQGLEEWGNVIVCVDD